MKGEVHHIWTRNHSQSLEQEVIVWKIQVENLPELLAL